MLLRARGFAGHAKPIRSVDGRAHRSLALLDRMGTVPALRCGAERVQTNRAIARWLERVQPEPPLFPADPQRRSAVEAAEEWGDETFQMAARRITLLGGQHGLDALRDHANDGRLGALLAKGERLRKINNQIAARRHLQGRRRAGRARAAGRAAQHARHDRRLDRRGRARRP